MSQLISGRKAAEILAVSPQTISNWVAAGKLVPAQTLENGYFLFERSVIEALAAAQRAEIEQPQPVEVAV